MAQQLAPQAERLVMKAIEDRWDIKVGVAAWRRMVAKYGRSVANQLGSLDDVLAEVRSGLLDAARRFNPNRGAGWSTWQTMVVHSWLTRWLKDQWKWVQFAFRQDREMAVDEVDVSADVSFFVANTEAIRWAVGRLPEPEQSVIRYLYWDGMHLREVGKIIGYHMTRIQQIHMVALERMREYLLR